MKEVFIFINGILTSPGNSRAWTDRAVQWCIRNAPATVIGDKFEYYSPALIRWLFQQGHAVDLAETIADSMPADGEGRLHLVGHSNGCDLIARAVRLTSAPIASVHLISGAVERDFAKNGLGERLARGQVGAVFCHCSKGDRVLHYLAPVSRAASLGLAGYGDLGYRGPAEPVPGKVFTRWREDLGHSDWFSPAEFDVTMRAILSDAWQASTAAGVQTSNLTSS